MNGTLIRLEAVTRTYRLGETTVPALRRLLCWAIAVGRWRATLKDSTLAQYRAKADHQLDRLLASRS